MNFRQNNYILDKHKTTAASILLYNSKQYQISRTQKRKQHEKKNQGNQSQHEMRKQWTVIISFYSEQITANASVV